MNILEYISLWIETKEKPPRSVFLIGNRKPTQKEIEYGKELEHMAQQLKATNEPIT